MYTIHPDALLTPGDVCVSPLAVNWVCKKADWDQQCHDFPNLCSLPQETSGVYVCGGVGGYSCVWVVVRVWGGTHIV